MNTANAGSGEPDWESNRAIAFSTNSCMTIRRLPALPATIYAQLPLHYLSAEGGSRTDTFSKAILASLTISLSSPFSSPKFSSCAEDYFEILASSKSTELNVGLLDHKIMLAELGTINAFCA